MKRLPFLLVLALALPLSASTYEFVDSLTMDVVVTKDIPIRDFYQDVACPNFYYRMPKADETPNAICKTALIEDSVISCYFALPDMQLEKIERYHKTEEGELIRTGKHSYYTNGHVYCEEIFHSGKLTASAWYDEKGLKTRYYSILKMKIVQRIDYYPGTETAKRMEQFDGNKVKTHFYNKDNKEIIPVLPKFKGGNDLLSERFSKEFALPERYIMNHFSYTLIGTVNTNGDLQPIKLQQRGTITSTVRGSSGGKSIEDSIMSWLTPYLKNHWIPGSVNGEPADLRVEIPLYYSPLYYAANGDKFYCNAKFAPIYNVHKTDTIALSDYYIRHNKNNPLHAIVERNGKKITVYYYNSFNDELLMTDNYTANAPDSLIRDGQRTYTARGNDTIHLFYKADTLLYADKINANGRARYTFYFSNVFTKLKTKDTYNAEGKKLTHVDFAEFTKESDVTTYYNDQEKAAGVKPSKDAQKKVNAFYKQYIKQNPIPKDNGASAGINWIESKIRVLYSVSATGEMTFVEDLDDGKHRWDYNYNTKITYPSKINLYINTTLASYTRQLMQALKEAKLTCTPAYADQTPVESTVEVVIKVSKSF